MLAVEALDCVTVSHDNVWLLVREPVARTRMSHPTLVLLQRKTPVGALLSHEEVQCTSTQLCLHVAAYRHLSAATRQLLNRLDRKRVIRYTFPESAALRHRTVQNRIELVECGVRALETLLRSPTCWEGSAALPTRQTLQQIIRRTGLRSCAPLSTIA